MPDSVPVRIACFTDVLCVWAYIAQVRLDELQHQFGERISVRNHFMPLFGDTRSRITKDWQNRGGYEGFGEHLNEVVRRFDHLAIHPAIWSEDPPASSASCHLYLKAVQNLVDAGTISDAHETRLDGRSLFEELLWQTRLAFFRDARNISRHQVMHDIAGSLGLPLDAIDEQHETGQAHAALCADFAVKDKYLVEGSPTLVLNEGRQKLYGNVGYRIIEANVQELLRDPQPGASWC